MIETAVTSSVPSVPSAAARPDGCRVVCHLIASNFGGGPEKQIVELCSRLKGTGWKGVVGSFRENRTTVEVIEAARERGLDSFLIDTRSQYSPRAISQLAASLRRFNVDLLVTHGYKANLVGYLATRRTGTPHVATLRGYTAEDWKVRTYEAVDRWLLRRVRCVFCVSQATRRQVRAFGVKADRIVVVPNAVDGVACVDAIDLRREFEFPADSVVLVAAGRLSPEKGHRVLVDATRQVAERLPSARLVILGSGPERTALERRIAGAGLGDRVVLAGFRPGAQRYLAGADLVVNPSLSEGLPNVVLEALAVGTPVVATDVGGVAELITPGVTGVLVPPADATALAGAIVDALSDPARARMWASNGRRRVLESYSFATQVERFTAAWERVIRPRETWEPVS